MFGRFGRVAGLFVLAGMLVALGAVPAQAQVLDQSQPVVGFGNPVDNAESAAQTFTAGLTGDLTRVDLNLVRDSDATTPLTLEIRTVDASGSPTNVILASEIIPASDVPSGIFAPTSVSIDPAVPIVAGVQYAIVLYTAAPPDDYRWGIAGDVYAGGNLFVSSTPPSSWSALPEFDAAFATYVRAKCAGLTTTVAGSGDITGTSAADVIVGSTGMDEIDGGGGDDVICAGGGDDVVSGGTGDDRVQGDAGSDEISGGPGADRLFGGDGADSLFGGSGVDRLFGEAGDDLASGDSGNDALSGAAGNDTLLGGTENDSLAGATGTDLCDGSFGTDTASMCETTVGVP
jgi:Ca2+-binding RTX toxin-like protein